MSRTGLLVLVAAMLGLGGCGGGGGGGGGPSEPPADVHGIWTITETMGENSCGKTVGLEEVYDVSIVQTPGASTFELTVLDRRTLSASPPSARSTATRSPGPGRSSRAPA